MLNNTYKLKYYLNINYITEVQKKKKIIKESNPRTFEIAIVINSKIGGHITFSYLEGLMESVLGPYQLTQINDVPPFNEIEPSSKNLAMFVKEKLEDVLLSEGCEILSIEIGETPLSFYIYNNRNDREYRRVKTYLNILHAVEQGGVLGEKHEHSLEVNCITLSDENVEDCIVEAISYFQGKYLNDLNDFYNVNPTLENISEFLKKELTKAIRDKLNGYLHSIEIAEKSTISYIC